MGCHVGKFLAEVLGEPTTSTVYRIRVNMEDTLWRRTTTRAVIFADTRTGRAGGDRIFLWT